MTAPAKKKVISLSAVTAIVLAIVIVISCVVNANASWIDTWLGRGAATVTNTGSDLDGN